MSERKWLMVPGCRGRAHITQRTYMKNGQERTVNDVAYYIDPEPAQPAVTVTQVAGPAAVYATEDIPF